MLSSKPTARGLGVMTSATAVCPGVRPEQRERIAAAPLGQRPDGGWVAQQLRIDRRHRVAQSFDIVIRPGFNLHDSPGMN